MFGRAPWTYFSVLTSSSEEGWNCDVLDDKQIESASQGLLDLQERIHVQGQERVVAKRARRREPPRIPPPPSFPLRLHLTSPSAAVTQFGEYSTAIQKHHLFPSSLLHWRMG